MADGVRIVDFYELVVDGVLVVVVVDFVDDRGCEQWGRQEGERGQDPEEAGM